MRIARAHWEEIVAHAREDAPNECCGYLWGTREAVEGVARAENERHSPYGYQLDSKSMLAVWRMGEEDGKEVVGTYHSHPRSPAVPSQTDINIADYPGWLYVIVSLEGEPEIRAWWIEDGRVTEEELVVEEGLVVEG